jgi:hypothetical protein
MTKSRQAEATKFDQEEDERERQSEGETNLE